MSKTFIVSSLKRWVFDDLQSHATKKGYDAHYDYGLDALDAPCDAVWWTPAGHATRLKDSGTDMVLQAPGPYWMVDDLPKKFLGREVNVVTLSDLRDKPSHGAPCHAKLAEAKHDTVDSRIYGNVGEFIENLDNSAVKSPDETVIQLSTIVEIIEEHRLFVAYRQIVAHSPYRSTKGDWEPGMIAMSSFDHKNALSFGSDVLGSVERQPNGFVLDVGKTVSGEWIVIETNPSWCSGIYDCERGGVFDSLTAACSHSTLFGWEPDPYLKACAAKRPLRHAPKRIPPTRIFGWEPDPYLKKRIPPTQS